MYTLRVGYGNRDVTRVLPDTSRRSSDRIGDMLRLDPVSYPPGKQSSVWSLSLCVFPKLIV